MNTKNTEPRTREMQETINHLILGITMWLSVTVTCVTTLLTVQQYWCLLALLIPFIYTMFPQIQKASAQARENAYKIYKDKTEKSIVDLDLAKATEEINDEQQIA